MIPDSHTHSHFSFDADRSASPDRIAEQAISLGMKQLAITDHLDINNIYEKVFPQYDMEAAYFAVSKTAKKYSSKLTLSYGIELGQPTEYPDTAREYIRKFKPQTVVASLHNIKGEIDFYSMDMRTKSEEEFLSLWNRYLEELSLLCDFEGIDIIAHLTYPLRYLFAVGRNINIECSYPKIEEIYKKIIKKELCLEVNTSGYRQKNSKGPLPEISLLSLYRDCGGKLISFGSDAHSIEHIGADFERASGELKAVGFEKVYFPFNKDFFEFRL